MIEYIYLWNSGLRGKFGYDNYANYIPSYLIYELLPGWSEYKGVVLLNMAEPPGKVGQFFSIQLHIIMSLFLQYLKLYN